MSETKRDYYEILGIEKDADDSDIKKAFRKLAKKYHPDRNPDKNAAKIFAEVNEAYEVLSDPEKRANYDKFGHDGIDGDGLGFNAEEVFSSFFDTIKQGGAFDDLDFDSEPGSAKTNKKSKKNKTKEDDEVSFDDYLKEETKEQKTKKRWSFFGKHKKDEDAEHTTDTKVELQNYIKPEQADINEPRFDANIDEEVINKNVNDGEVNFESGLNETKEVDNEINFEANLEKEVNEESKTFSDESKTQEQSETEYWEKFVGNPDYGYYDENNDWQWKGYFNDNQEWIPINDQDNLDEKTVSETEKVETKDNAEEESEKANEVVSDKNDEDKKDLVEDSNQEEIKKEEKEEEIPKSSSIGSSTSSFDLSFLFNKAKKADEDQAKKANESDAKVDEVTEEIETPTEEITTKEIEEIIDIPPVEEETKEEVEQTKEIDNQKTDEAQGQKEKESDESKGQKEKESDESKVDEATEEIETPTEEIASKEIEEIIDIPTAKEDEQETKEEVSEKIDELIDEKTTSEVQSEIAEKMKIAPLDQIELSSKDETDNKPIDDNLQLEDIEDIKKDSKKKQVTNKNINKTIIFEDDNFDNKDQNYKNTEELLKSTFGKDGIDSILDSDEFVNDKSNKKVPIIEAVESDKNKQQDYTLSDADSKLLNDQQEFALQINKQTDIDIVYQANVHQLLLFNNAVKRISYYRHIPCEVCDATGTDLAFKNKAIKVCPVCKNNSKEVENCKTCNGFGRLITKPCKQCKGKSYCKEQIVLDIKLPITTNLCLEVTYPGFGHIISKEVKGDFKVIFNVIESKFFKARGNNIWTLALIDPAVAAVGGSILVPTLNKLIELKINGGVMSGDELIIKKMGLPPRYDSTINKHFNKQGDLIIKIKYADVNKVNPKVSVQELSKQPNAHVNKYNSLVKNEISYLDNNAQLLKTIEPKLNKKEIKNNEFEWIKNYKFVETKIDQPENLIKKHKQTTSKSKKSSSKSDTTVTKKHNTNSKHSKTKNISTKTTKAKSSKKTSKSKNNSKKN